MRRAIIALALVLLTAGVGVAALVGGGDDPLESPEIVRISGDDPFAYRKDADDEFLRRGRDGSAHVLYALSPGGVERTAERVIRWKPLIRRAAERHGVNPATLESIVFLESAGRPEVIAGPTPESASGLGQILPGTGTDLLGMSIDLSESKRLTRAIQREAGRAEGQGRPAARRIASRRVDRLSERRRRVDERFEPAKALDGAARYLSLSERHLGREDLAVAAYHMGIGNLEDIIAAYISPQPVSATTRQTVRDNDISYSQLYFDSSPVRNPRTYEKLRRLGDDSRSYLFRVEAAREILRLHRQSPDELSRLAELHGRKASAEEVLRPQPENPPYEGADDLQAAYDRGELIALPSVPRRLGYRIDPGMGELAPKLDERRSLYRGLRPEAFATLLHIARQVREVAGQGTLTLTSTVRDVPYTRLLAESNPEATRGFSLHTTGYAFDIARDLRDDERRALVYALERLRALAVIDWVYEPGAIHVTVGPDGGRFLERLESGDRGQASLTNRRPAL